MPLVAQARATTGSDRGKLLIHRVRLSNDLSLIVDSGQIHPRVSPLQLLLPAIEILDVSCVLQIGAWLLGLGLLSASAVVVTWGNATSAVASTVAVPAPLAPWSALSGQRVATALVLAIDKCNS